MSGDVKSISLREMIAGCQGFPRQGTIWPEIVASLLWCRDPLNAHFFYPPDELSGKPCGRDVPLSLDERVYGDHLLLTFHGHDPMLILSEHDSLDEMRSEILG